MATQTVEKELVQLEKDYWEALKDGDRRSSPTR